MVWTVAIGRALSITAIQLVDNFHSLRDNAKWRKTIAVQRGVIPEVDENLRAARIGCRSLGERNKSPMIALKDAVVLNIRFFPGIGDLGIRAESKLRHESRQNAKETRAVIKMMPDKIVEAVRAVGRPRARHMDREFALSGHKFDVVFRGCLRD